MTFRKTGQKFYYGWVIVFIAGMGVFFSGPGQTYSNSIFIDEYIREFGWSRSQVSGIYSGATLCAGLLMLFVGRFIDRFGQRLMMVLIGSLLAIACLYNSIVTNVFMLAIGFFLIRLLGQGSMSLIPNTLVSQWFIKKRGRAFSFMTLGSFASASMFPIINAWLIQTWDWQFAWRFWGIALLVLFVPLALFGVRNRPKEMGLTPDGNSENTAKGPVMSAPLPEAGVDFTLREAARTRAFWLILVCVGIPSMVNTGITFHIVSIFSTNDLSAGTAALVLSLMALVGVPMSFVSGFITEKIRTNYLLVFIFIIEVILLLLLVAMDSFWMAILFGVVWGMANGFERIGTNIIWPDYFGRKHIGSINGVGMTIVVIGSALGPLPFGMGYDLFHSYNQVLLLSLLFPVIGIISALLARKPQKESGQVG